MAKSRNRKDQKSKAQKRKQAIDKENIRKIETMNHNFSIFEQVMREFAQERIDRQSANDEEDSQKTSNEP